MPLYRHTQLMRRALTLSSQLSGNAREIALQAHDLICEMTDYEPDSESPHTAYGALLSGQAVCDGYAKAFTLLCRLRGIPCSMVSGITADSAGTQTPHSWNLLRLDGFYTLADVTWDDAGDEALHSCLFVTDDMLNGHVRDDESLRLPAADAFFSVNP